MIFRVTNPAAARVPVIRDAVRRAIEESGFEHGDLDRGADHLLACCWNSHLGLWVWVEGGAVLGVIACSLPNNPLGQSPEVFVNANWGGPAVGKALIAAAVEFQHAAGYNRMVAFNRTGRPDAVVMRRYRGLGTGRVLGSMIEFTEAAG